MSNAGRNLKYLRKLRGWTQEEFANKLKIKRSLVGAYEEERAEPKLEVMEQVCSIFKLSLEDFLFKDFELEDLELVRWYHTTLYKNQWWLLGLCILQKPKQQIVQCLLALPHRGLCHLNDH